MVDLLVVPLTVVPLVVPPTVVLLTVVPPTVVLMVVPPTVVPLMVVPPKVVLTVVPPRVVLTAALPTVHTVVRTILPGTLVRQRRHRRGPLLPLPPIRPLPPTPARAPTLPLRTALVRRAGADPVTTAVSNSAWPLLPWARCRCPQIPQPVVQATALPTPLSLHLPRVFSVTFPSPSMHLSVTPSCSCGAPTTIPSPSLRS